MLRDLRYNGVNLDPLTVKNNFIMGLGSEFFTIRNMKNPPKEFQTKDLDLLTTAAREQLALVHGNRAIQRQQQAIVKERRQQDSARTNTSSSNQNATQPPTYAAAAAAGGSNTTQPSASRPTRPTPTTRPNGQPDTRTDCQREIMREIGFRQHTPARINYWRSFTQPTHCYYHRSDNHTSEACQSLISATRRANQGTMPNLSFTPNPRFQCPPATTPTPSNTTTTNPPEANPNTSGLDSNQLQQHPPTARVTQAPPEHTTT